MKCALCKANEANKTNTHFLTDAIIRPSLNYEGSTKRDRGYNWSMVSGSPFAEFGFQRSTEQEAIEKALGRPPTEEEIEKAKDVSFSVDYVFCSECEKIFTKIETEFIVIILPKFRKTDLTGKDFVVIEKSNLFQLFFYLQVWRSAICDKSIEITPDVMESMRLLILSSNSESITGITMPNYPLSVYYLHTIDDPTSNVVSLISSGQPVLISMADFFIQFFEDTEDIKFYNFCGLIEKEDFEKYFNLKTKKYKVKIVSNSKRKIFVKKIFSEYVVTPGMKNLMESFRIVWLVIMRSLPTKEVCDEFTQQVLLKHDGTLNNSSQEVITKRMHEFIMLRKV